MSTDVVDLGFAVGTSDIDHAIKKFGLLDREFGKVEKSGGLVSRSFESVGDAGKKSGGLVSRAFREASQDLDKTNNSAKLVSSSFDSLRKVAGGLGGVLAGIGFGNMMSDALERAKEIQRVSSAFGVNTQSLQEWQLVAKKSGVEADKMGDIFKDISDKIGDFALTGGGEAKDLFETLKLNINEFKNLSPERAFEKIGIALKNSGLTQSQKTFLLEGLADDASLLLPKLENISAELTAVRAAGEKTGSIMSQADLDSLNAANAAISSLQTAWMGLSNNIGVAGSVIITTFAPYVQAGIEWVSGLFNSLATGLSAGVQFINQFASSIAPVMGYLGDFAEGVALIIAGSLGLTAVSMAFGAISTAVSALGAILLANPIVATIAVIAGAASLIRQNWEPISAWWGDFWSVFDEPATQAFNDLKSTIEGSAVGQAVKDIWDKLPAETKASLDGLVSSVEDTFSHITDVINDKGLVAGGIQLFQELNLKVLESLSDLAAGVQSLWSDMLSSLDAAGVLGVLSDAWETAKDAVLRIAEDLLDGLDRTWADTLSGLDAAFGDIGGILSEAGQTFGALVDWVAGLLSDMQSDSGSTLSAIGDYFAQTWGLITGTVADAWNLITNIIGTSWDFAVGIITTGLQLLRGDWDGAWATMQGTLGGFYNGVVGIINSLVNLFSNFASRVGAILSNVWNGLQSLVGAASAAQGISASMQEVHAGKMADDLVRVDDAARQVGVSLKSTDVSLKAANSSLFESAKAAFNFAEQQRRVRNVQEDVRKHVDGLGQAHQAAIAPVTGLGGAVGKSGDAAKKAAGGHKGLSDAQKEAKKSAEDLARAQEKIADLFTKEAQKHDVLTLKLNQGAAAARALELQYQTIHNGVKILTDAKAAELVQMESANKALEEEIKKRDDLAKAIEKAGEAVKKSETAMQIAKDSIHANDEALRALTLTHEQGYSKAAAQTQAHNEALTESYKNQRDLVEDLAKLTSELASSDAQLAALKAGGVAAMDAEATRQSALNDLKEKGISVESALGQQYLTAKAAIEAKNKALEAEQDIQKNLQGIRDLDAEIAATKLGSAALAEANLQKEIRNKLDALGLTQESALGQRIAETTRQLFAKNKQLEVAQSLAQLRTDNEWLRKEIAATQKGEQALKELNIQKTLFAELSRLGIQASSAAAAQLEREIRAQYGLKDALEASQKTKEAYQGIGDAIAGGFLSGNWKEAGQGVLAQLKGTFVDPLKKSLSDAITQGLAGGANGGFLGSIAKLLNFDGIKGALGGVGSSVGGLFSGIASSAANGFAGIGTAISGGLSGIMGSFGTLVSAIPGWGWAIAGVAGLAKLFGGPSAPKINLTQGAKDGQGMLTDGQQHYTKTALGTVGATDSSYKIGREKGFVPKLHEWFKWVESFDGMIAKTLPNSIAAISEALKGVEMKGANLEGFTRQRLHTIFSALPEALQVAIQGSKSIMSGTTEEIAARFAYMAQVAESGLIPALEQLGLAGTQSKESMIAFAMSLSDALGGIDAAKAALDNYYQAAYTEAERLALSQSAAKTKLDEYNKSLGLSGTQYIDTIAELRAYIEAQDKNTEAGQKAIAAALGMVDALKTLGGTAEEAAQKLKGQWDDFNAAAYTDAQKQQIAQNQAKKAIDAFNQSLGLTGNKTIDNIIELRAYMRTLDGSTEAGRKAQQAALGMTSAFVAFGGTAEQIKQKIAGLRESIKGLVTNLYSSGSSSLTSTSTSTADSNQAALSAAQASLDSLRSQLNSEQDRISEVNNQAKAAYQNQLDYYRTLKDAAENLRNVANGFADDARSAADVLKSAQLDYNRTLQAAKSGDVEAAKKLGDMATRLKSAVSVAYNNDGRSASAIQQIEDQLRSTAGVLDGLAGSQPNDPGTITSTLIASLQSQISAQESVVNSLQSIASNASSAANEAKATADRAAMAKELATKIGELGLATDKSAWQILTANGINIKDLAVDFGINVNKLDATFIKNTADLATRLNVNSLDLLTRLNVNFSDLAKSFNIDVNNLNNGTLGKLDKLADQLHVSSVDLAAKLGINIDQLGDLMANKLAALPNIPADIKAGLAPHLQDIRNAADPATLQRELKELQAYVNTLPPGIRAQLNGQLDGILGYTGDTKTNTNDTKNETMALRNVSSRITDLTIYTRDQLTGQYLTGVWQNLKSLNKNAANIGKSAIPSFAVGSDKLPSDMLANVHRGEMIFTAAQSNSMRDLAIYNQSVIPQIASYLSEIAANDSQAPVFIQPVYVAPVNSQRRTDSGKDELLEEVKGLRKDNAELKKAVEDLMPYQFAIANNTRKSAAMMDKWDTDGLPEERAA